MGLPVLDKKQQKKTLSALKKDKKVKKNVLAPPENLRMKNPIFSESDTLSITKLLESLLPSARLTVTQSSSKQPDDVSGAKSEKLSSEQYIKRNQLLIGINAVSRGLSKKTVISLLLADDIQPQFLYSHLLVLCSLKHVPYMFMPGFRELTRNTLGFPCIVLGFKKNSTFFLPVINLVKSVFLNCNTLPELEVKKVECNVNSVVCDETEKEMKEFTYIERSSKLKRAFVPDLIASNTKLKEQGKDFIPVSSDIENKKNSVVVKKELKKIEGETFLQKGKSKKVFQKKQNEKKFFMPCKYYKSEVVEVASNPNRSKKKYKKLK